MKFSNNQQGSAVFAITVIVLLLITIIGAVAVRQSMTGLNISTNAQAKQIMFQSSDAALSKFQNANGTLVLSVSNILELSRNNSTDGKEIVFCYQKTQAEFFSNIRYSVTEWIRGQGQPSSSHGVLGYCQAGNNNFFNSGRNAVLTQISIQNLPSETTQPFEGQSLGTDIQSLNSTSGGGNTPQVNYNLRVYAVSLMPTLSSASNENINTCLRSRMNNPINPDSSTSQVSTEQTISQCLNVLAVPFVTLTSDFLLIQDEFQKAGGA
ncbi:hypothetical protein GCM10027155_17850 [Acinetobacter apis]|uniref:Type IV pilus assembly protein PilX n=1 Tax=Acinetobacter apis TaxID=1229165 RepID=A0A217EGJ7_9GAMM|nr:pilus assembly protein PilX [Acinetobacter apis]SNQ29477.1 hypothetical protein SAMN05444584_1431 [Acinetobacter apis]